MSCGEIMKQLFPGIWQWAWFSEEKQLDFNGLFLMVGEHKILVDPPPMTAEARSFLRRNGPVDYIIVTNRDHLREAAACQAEFTCRLYVPEADAAQMDVKPTKTYTDGELLPGGIWAIRLSDQKSPGESALFLDRGQGIMIVGDACSLPKSIPMRRRSKTDSGVSSSTILTASLSATAHRFLRAASRWLSGF
jgi:glyoxylase-like metal-dependent hydrolase (beta-lactamase superfamily II)